MNLNKHIWEGWTVQAFIDDLQPILDMIQKGHSWQPAITTKQGMKEWLMDNQPYFKKHIPDLVKYFVNRYNIKN